MENQDTQAIDNINNSETEFKDSIDGGSGPMMTSIDYATWSWGSFMFPWITILAAKKYVYLLLFLLYIVPLVNILAGPIIHIYFGLKGREFINQHNQAFANQSETDGFVRGLDRAGKISFFAALVIFVVVFASVLLGAAAMFDTAADMEARLDPTTSTFEFDDSEFMNEELPTEFEFNSY